MSVLPDERWRRLNDKYHKGARLTEDDFDELLNLALEYHLRAIKAERKLEEKSKGVSK